MTPLTPAQAAASPGLDSELVDVDLGGGTSYRTTLGRLRELRALMSKTAHPWATPPAAKPPQRPAPPPRPSPVPSPAAAAMTLEEAQTQHYCRVVQSRIAASAEPVAAPVEADPYIALARAEARRG